MGDTKVSVLVPARDEEANIGPAVDSILASQDVNLELIVCDDDSTDRTSEIVNERAARDGRLRLIRAPALATAAVGKPAACQCLADASSGSILVFIDADVRVSRLALAAIATVLLESNAGLISGIPLQRTKSWSERLIVPLMDFVLYGYLPVYFMRRSDNAAFGAACGQLVAVKREPYEAVGGHAAVAHNSHDGIALARRFRRNGYQTDLIDATSLADCRMYTSWREVRDGFAKNAHEGLGSTRGIVPWTVILGLGQVAPFIMLPAMWAVPGAAVPLSIAVAIVYLTRVSLAIRCRHGWVSVLAHPAGVMLLIGIQWYALARRLLKRPTRWRGRRLPVA